MAYAALSPRTTERALNYWCGAMQLGQVPFIATMDGTLTGQPVYHTNVLMSIGETLRGGLLRRHALPGRSRRCAGRAGTQRQGDHHHHPRADARLRRQPAASCGSLGRRRFIFLSESAFALLDPKQRVALEKHGQIVPVPVPTIEAVGGGSVRCMLAENFFLSLSRGWNELRVYRIVAPDALSGPDPSDRPMFQDRLQAQLVPALQARVRRSSSSMSARSRSSSVFQPTRPEFEGDVTINVFPFLKLNGKGTGADGHGDR